jgi:hypothetical protein
MVTDVNVGTHAPQHLGLAVAPHQSVNLVNREPKTLKWGWTRRPLPDRIQAFRHLADHAELTDRLTSARRKARESIQRSLGG